MIFLEDLTCHDYIFAARLREPQDGLFSGQVEAVDIQDDTYRITFDREGEI